MYDQNLLSFIINNYEIIDKSFSIKPANLGTGKNYLLTKNDINTYFVKLFDKNSIYENISDEIIANSILINNHFPTPCFLKNIYGLCITQLDENSSIVIQEFKSGHSPNKFSLSLDQSLQAIQLLAKMNILLSDCQFKQRFLDLVQNLSLRKKETIDFLNLFEKNKRNNKLLHDLLQEKIKCLEALEKVPLDMTKFTFVNSHGDYNCLQLLMQDNGTIAEVVDFSRVASVPAIWEIIRFYSYADAGCKNCNIDLDYLRKLINEYEKYIKLNEYDKEKMFVMYAMQILSSHFGYKGYIEQNNEKALDFAIWRIQFAKTLLVEAKII